MKRFSAIVLLVLSFACNTKKKPVNSGILSDAMLLHQNMQQLTDVIMHDAFSPPVASRIYAYTSLAAYEALRFDKHDYTSVAAQLDGFEALPVPDGNKEYNYLLASTRAFFTVAESITFSRDSLARYQEHLYADFAHLLDEETYRRSLDFGETIGKVILQRTTADNYKQTRGMSKFLGSNDAGKWRPTAPDYLDGAEPYWGMIRPLMIDSVALFKCPPPPAFSTDTASEFYRSVKEVYTITTNLSEEQRTIARYWDDNPFVMEHSGHLMYANKKITPPGHWIGITAIACKMTRLNPVETAQRYLLVAGAMLDAFIACWEEKYRSNVVRPITVINEGIDRNWQPMLQTPPFPEYTSGHSGVSGAAAAMLTTYFGDNFAFEDTSDLKYIGMKRSFPSFHHAAREASISRVYGGIHYRNSVDAGAVQGIKIAEYISKKLRLKDTPKGTSVPDKPVAKQAARR